MYIRHIGADYPGMISDADKQRAIAGVGGLAIGAVVLNVAFAGLVAYGIYRLFKR